MNGMRVKLTFSFTAGGNSFPVAVTVTGLTEKEMPPGEDFIHVEIPGMCIGGGDVGVGSCSSQQVGHLFLMRNSEGGKSASSTIRNIFSFQVFTSSARSIVTMISMKVKKSLMN